MKKLIIVFVFFLAILAAPANAAGVKKVYVKSEKLTARMLETRRQKKIEYIEIITTKAISAKKGKTAGGAAIRYHKRGIKRGDVVKVYLHYNPRTNSPDDVTKVDYKIIRRK